MHGDNALLAYCQHIPSSSNEIEIPVDETTPWQSSGIIASWDNEGSASTGVKPELSLARHRLKKLRVLIPASEELVSDSKAFSIWFPKAMNRAVAWKFNDTIINGLGVDRPLGILNSDAVIEVAKDGAQGAGTIVDANIAAMLARSLDPINAVWVANTGAYGQLANLAGFDSGTRRLAGLPIVTTDACPALGTAGDLILANMNAYRVVSKGWIFSDSAHLWFDQDIHAFRLTVRVDGQPILHEPTTPPNAGSTRSHFVTLATRT
jgi:HK97 family phage major capsid protein